MPTRSPKEQICKRLLISGRVQNVIFRQDTYKKALTLGLTGSMRYLPDGRVEAMIQGDRAVVDAMLSWIWSSSPQSRVENVEIEPQELKPFRAFEIRYSIYA